MSDARVPGETARPRRQLVKYCVLLLSVLGLVAAGRASAPERLVQIGDYRLQPDGMTIGDLARQSDTSVVLFYSPTDCVACYGVLAEWLHWEASGGGELHLVLTAEPTPDQAAVLREYNIEHPLVLMRRRAPVVHPATHLFVRGRHIATAIVRPGRDFLLAEMRTASISEPARNGSPLDANQEEQ